MEPPGSRSRGSRQSTRTCHTRTGRDGPWGCRQEARLAVLHPFHQRTEHGPPEVRATPISVSHSSTARRNVSLACCCDRRSSRCARLDTRPWTTVRPDPDARSTPSTAPRPPPCSGGGRWACGGPATCPSAPGLERVLVDPNLGRERGGPVDLHIHRISQHSLQYWYIVLVRAPVHSGTCQGRGVVRAVVDQDQSLGQFPSFCVSFLEPPSNSGRRSFRSA